MTRNKFEKATEPTWISSHAYSKYHYETYCSICLLHWVVSIHILIVILHQLTTHDNKGKWLRKSVYDDNVTLVTHLVIFWFRSSLFSQHTTQEEGNWEEQEARETIKNKRRWRESKGIREKRSHCDKKSCISNVFRCVTSFLSIPKANGTKRDCVL